MTAAEIRKSFISLLPTNCVVCGENNQLFKPDIKPDIAIDDVQDCELGIINLIVREK
jgi:hypothetical protein